MTDVLARSKTQLASTLPQFVIENHPKFVSFVKAYYGWSATEGPELAFEVLKFGNDIDLMLGDMLFGVKSMVAKDFPGTLKTDFRHFAKFLKEFYQIKGSPESFRIFFNAVFGVNSSVIFPRDFLFKPSFSKWKSQNCMKIGEISGNLFEFLDQEILSEENAGFCTISNIVMVEDGYLAYFDSLTGIIATGDTLKSKSTDARATVLGVYKVDTVTSAATWKEGDLINSNGIILEVEKIKPGFITSLAITNGGSGYEIDDTITTVSEYQGSGFVAKVTSVNGSGAITGVKVIRKGFGYKNPSIDFVVETLGGTGAVFTPTWNSDFRKIAKLKIIKNKTLGSDPLTITVGGTTISMVGTPYFTEQKWVGYKTEPSNKQIRIHDSSYYQEFSYDIQAPAKFKELESSIREVLGIAGLKMFCTEVVEAEIETPTSPENISVTVA